MLLLHVQLGLYSHLYQDAKAPIPARVADLLAKITVEEKVAQIQVIRGTKRLPELINTSFGVARTPSSLSARNAMQKTFMEGSRLNIPVSFYHESLHSGSHAAVKFPELVTLGATWDVELVEKVYVAVAEATRSAGCEIAFAPVLNMWTDPRNGRHQEGFSPDPTLTARMAEAAVVGLQGPSGSATDYMQNYTANVVSLGKHFAAYGGGSQNGAPPRVSERNLRDVYLKPWKAFAAAGGRGVMPAHNTALDVPCHANEWMMNDVLRKEYGFGDGVSLSDCNDIGVLTFFRIAANMTHAGAKALNARAVDLDLQCGGSSSVWAYDKISDALSRGLVENGALDDATRRVLTMKFAAGLFDQPYSDESADWHIQSAEKKALARRAAQHGTVLIANGAASTTTTTSAKKTKRWHWSGSAAPLPLDAKQIKDGSVKVGVIGPLAHGAAVNSGYIGSYADDTAAVSLLDGLSSVVFGNGSAASTAGGKPDRTLPFAQGAALDSPEANATMVAAAVKLAQDSDVAILVLGDTPDEVGEWKDRSSLDLKFSQLDLLNSVASAIDATKTALVLVLVHGNQLTFGAIGGVQNAVLAHVDALLSAGRPGQLGGLGIADLLVGTVSPSGRLAANWPQATFQVGTGATPFLARVVGKWIANGRSDPDAVSLLYTVTFYANLAHSLTRSP